MTELKTLKDIGQSKRKCCSIEEDYNNICEKCLKAEAIKCHSNPKFDQWTVEDFIEWFFNIIEDDLQ